MKEREYFYILYTVLYLEFRKLRGRIMAPLPSTIYNELTKIQRELYQAGGPPSVGILDIYDVFMDNGYGLKKCHKWLLNWAYCRRAKFERDKDGGYRVQFGTFGSDIDCMLGGTLWLPLDTVKLKVNGKLCEVKI